MAAPWGSRAGRLVALLVLVTATRLPAAEVVPLAVKDGRCAAVLPTDRPGEQYYLVVGSLARSGGPHRISVRTEAASGPVVLPTASCGPPAAWRERVLTTAERLKRARRSRPAPRPYPAPESPPREKTFYLFVQDRSFHDPHSYAAVHAELEAVGKHCQVYVDRAFTGRAELRPTVEDAVRCFDEDVWSRSRRLGEALDVDRDGRFTILFTGLLAKLQAGKVSLGGCVRGSDFYRDLDAPFGNRCDMMYLNTDLRPGAHLHALLAHEYTHAVVFSEHVFGEYLPGAARHDEESWLNEGLAHVVEDRHGWSNLDYRVSAFLSAPERYPLVVPDYYSANLWRTPGVRGAAYLFARWCADRHGEELLPRLVRSSLKGTDNLEAATQEPFPELFRRWSVAMVLSGSGGRAEGYEPLRRFDLRQQLAGRLLCGPRAHPLELSGARQEIAVADTAFAVCQLHSPAGHLSRLVVEADPRAELQATLIRMPAGTPRLEASAVRDADGKTVRVRLTAHGAAVRLEAAAWEKLAPAGSAGDTGAFECGAKGGAAALAAGEMTITGPFPAPEGECVIKVLATDDAGRRLAAWAAVPAR